MAVALPTGEAVVCEPFRQLQSRLSNPHDRFVKLVSARPPNKGTSLPKTVRCLTNYNRPSMRVLGPGTQNQLLQTRTSPDVFQSRIEPPRQQFTIANTARAILMLEYS